MNASPSPGQGGAIAARLGEDFPKRAATGLAMMAAALASAWVGGLIFAIFWSLAAIAVLWEWQSLIGADHRIMRVGLGALAMLQAIEIAAPQTGMAWLLIQCAVTALLLIVCVRLRGDIPAGWVLAGVAYATALLLSVLALRNSASQGLDAIFWLFGVVWGTDIMAYVGGRLIGGPKLWPQVSPGKTWSGFLVGVFCGAIIGAMIAPARSGWPWILVFSLATAAASQGGDLFESALKRRFGAKDSGALIPGHGGVMDRLDGFIAASVFAALVAACSSPLRNLAAGLF